MTKDEYTITDVGNFIEYLFDNKERFAANNPLIENMQELNKRSGGLQPKKYTEHREKQKGIQAEQEELYIKIEEKVNNPIKEKGKEIAGLVFDYGVTDKNHLLGIFSTIGDISRQDIELISNYMDKYHEFKQAVNPAYTVSRDALDWFFGEVYSTYIKGNPYGIEVKNKHVFEPDVLEQGSSKQPTLPKELQTDKAKELFDKAIQAGVIAKDNDLYKWNFERYTGQLLAYFSQRASHYLNLSKRADKDGNNTVNWRAFEICFNRKKIISFKNDWMKANTKFTPNGYEKIDKLFD